MELLELKDFSDGGAFFEDDFDKKFKAFDWTKFNDKSVRISPCGLELIPAWVHLLIGIKLSRHARKIFFGDSGQPKRIFKRDENKKEDEQVSHGS